MVFKCALLFCMPIIPSRFLWEHNFTHLHHCLSLGSKFKDLVFTLSRFLEYIPLQCYIYDTVS